MMSKLVAGSALGATALLAAGGCAYAALYPTSQIFGSVLIAGTDSDELALTFDDGPNPAATPRILELLARHGVHATFFLIGDFVRAQPALARRIAAAGHLIANHTMTHPKLAWQSAARIRQELRGTNELLEDTVSAPIRYFRPPHGARRPYVMQAAKELGLTTVMWNVTALDWEPIGTQAITKRIESGIARNMRKRRGSNVLLHDGGHLGLGADRQATVEATAQLLERPSRYRLVTIDRWRPLQDERELPDE